MQICIEHSLESSKGTINFSFSYCLIVLWKPKYTIFRISHSTMVLKILTNSPLLQAYFEYLYFS